MVGFIEDKSVSPWVNPNPYKSRDDPRGDNLTHFANNPNPNKSGDNGRGDDLAHFANLTGAVIIWRTLRTLFH